VTRALLPAVLAGAGNVFAVLTVDELGGRPASALARELCAARGLDGLLEVRAPDGSAGGAAGDLRMVIWNADGSRAEACGNGLRCVALFARERGLVAGDRVLVETDCGTRAVELLRGTGPGRPVVAARACLGRARVLAVNERLELDGEPAPLEVALVDVGNPHCVLFVARPELARLERLGPALATHARFPAGTNVELACVDGRPGPITARVWERGVGETQACGTGAAAIALAAEATGRAALPAEIALPGGLLTIDRDDEGLVHLTGPVETRT
jgi:diaminopimelate epimerase